MERYKNALFDIYLNGYFKNIIHNGQTSEYLSYDSHYHQLSEKYEVYVPMPLELKKKIQNIFINFVILFASINKLMNLIVFVIDQK